MDSERGPGEPSPRDGEPGLSRGGGARALVVLLVALALHWQGWGRLADFRERDLIDGIETSLVAGGLWLAAALVLALLWPGRPPGARLVAASTALLLLLVEIVALFERLAPSFVVRSADDTSHVGIVLLATPTMFLLLVLPPLGAALAFLAVGTQGVGRGVRRLAQLLLVGHGLVVLAVFVRLAL